eukprot:scaffold25839_cov66-Phaeocystis_antarctica.AAC.1
MSCACACIAFTRQRGQPDAPHGEAALRSLARTWRAPLAAAACPSAAASPTVASPTPCCSSAVLALALSRTARSESLRRYTGGIIIDDALSTSMPVSCGAKSQEGSLGAGACYHIIPSSTWVILTRTHAYLLSHLRQSEQPCTYYAR